MKFALILATLTQEPLYMLPEKARTIIDLVEARAFGVASGRVPETRVTGNAGAANSEPGVIHYLEDEDTLLDSSIVLPMYTTQEGVAVIDVEGIIGKRLSGMAVMCGACDLDTLSTALRAAMADSNVSAIVLDINSPGGTGIGLPEISSLIAKASQSKPIVAFTDYQACSAAYWIAAQCDAIYCTPSAVVGSIGAYIAAVDDSAAWKSEGRERLVFNGSARYKAMGTSGKAWTQEEKDFMQARSEKATAGIRAAAQTHRTLAEEDMQGQVFDGPDALTHNLVDGLVDSREELLAMLASAS